MATFFIYSRHEKHLVCVNDKDVGRVKDYANTDNEYSRHRDKFGYLKLNKRHQEYGAWHIVWKEGKIDAVAATIPIGFKSGTKYGRRTKQVKLHDFILGEYPRCKTVRHRDGNPLNNRRENLVLYQAYQLKDMESVPTYKRLKMCLVCKDGNTCRKVVTRKKITDKGRREHAL